MKLIGIAVGTFLLATLAGAGIQLALSWPKACARVEAAAQARAAGVAAASGEHDADLSEMHAIGHEPGSAIGPELPAETESSPANSRNLEFGQLARVLENVPPDEAATFLRHLNEDQCVAILRAMSVRSCASVLDYLPADRAESVEKRLFSAMREAR